MAGISFVVWGTERQWFRVPRSIVAGPYKTVVRTVFVIKDGATVRRVSLVSTAACLSSQTWMRPSNAPCKAWVPRATLDISQHILAARDQSGTGFWWPYLRASRSGSIFRGSGVLWAPTRREETASATRTVALTNNYTVPGTVARQYGYPVLLV